jgi:hypothetical protein
MSRFKIVTDCKYRNKRAKSKKQAFFSQRVQNIYRFLANIAIYLLLTSRIIISKKAIVVLLMPQLFLEFIDTIYRIATMNQ